MNFIYFIAIGSISGLIAHYIFKNSGLGIFTNIISGIIGTFLGFILLAYIMNLSFIPEGVYSNILGFVGALTTLGIVNLIYKSTH